MSTAYTGVTGNVSNGAVPARTLPADGDARNAASVNTPFQTGADWDRFLYESMLALQLGNFALRYDPGTANLFYAGGTWLGIDPDSGNDYFLLVGGISGGGGSGRIEVTDGVVTKGTGTPAAAYTGIFYCAAVGAGVVAIAGSSGELQTAPYSTSFTTGTWTHRTAGVSTESIRSMVFAASKFVAVTSGGKYTTSADGITWSAGTIAGGINFQTVVYSSALSLFIAVGGHVIYTSPDGVTWTLRYDTSDGATSIVSVAVNSAGKCVAVGTPHSTFTGLYTSSNGTAWTPQTLPNGVREASQVIHDGRVFYGGGSYGAMWSTDGVSWHTATITAAYDFGAPQVSALFAAPAGSRRSQVIRTRGSAVVSSLIMAGPGA